MFVEHHISFHNNDVFLLSSKNDTYLLYAPTLKKLFHVNYSLAKSIIKNNLTHLNEDPELNKVVDTLNNAIPTAIKPFPVHLKKSKYFHLALGLTRDCNLNCLYCHAESGINDDMPIELLNEALQYSLSCSQKDNLKGINISFAVGGEPTTNWNLFKECIFKIKELKNIKGLRVHTSMTTNGFYGYKKRDFIASNVDSVLLSLDGPPDIQNLHRPSKGGKETYQTVKESALFFLDRKVNFSIRATVSNVSVNRMPEIVKYFFREFGKDYHLVFEPLVLLGRATRNLEIVREPSNADFIKYYIESKNLSKKIGIELRTSADNHKRLVTSFCGAMSIPSFTVTTDGIITTCERDSKGTDYSYGKYSFNSKKFILDNKRIEKNKGLLTMPEKCKSCFCKWHCAGDCPDVRMHLNYNRCEVVKALTQHSLELMLTKN